MFVNGLLKTGKAVMSNSGKVAKTCKADIPRYLYHVTSKKNYDLMLKSGEIFGTHDGNIMSNLEGVFLFDLKNFSKRWLSTYFDMGEVKINLGAALLGKNSANAVVLRIPTKNFDVDKLKIRVQKKFKDDYHSLNGDYARFQTLYTRRKKPIEYIYGQNINISDVEKIGEVELGFPDKYDFFEFEEVINFFTKKPFEELLKIFRGQPEEKGILAMQKANIKDKVLKF